MNDELYNRLKPFEQYLGTAYRAQYVRGLTSKQLDELTLIAKELGITFKYNGCSKCTYNFVKRLADLYYNYETSKVEEGSEETNNPPRNGKRKKANKNNQ